MDALQDLLAAMRLTGGLFLEGEFTAPWCVTAGVSPEDCRPYLPEPRTVIAYHYVVSGRLVLELDGRAPMPVEGGEIIVLPRNDTHRLASAPGLPAVPGDRLIQPGEDGGLARIDHGGGGERTAVLCGFLGSEAPREPLLELLPSVLKLDVGDATSGSWIESSFRFAAQALHSHGNDSPLLLGRIAEVLFMEAVRRYVASLPGEEGRWIAALGDPAIARALGVIHGRFSERWTTEGLARIAGLSRSAFAERFTRALGEPPMRYLSSWRLRCAATRLSESRDPVARIALDVGYDSEAAFNRAFKRAFAVPPATWRRQQQRRGGAPGAPETRA